MRFKSAEAQNLRRDGKSPALQPAIAAMVAAGYSRDRIIAILGIRNWGKREFGKLKFAGGIERQEWFQEVSQRLAEAALNNAGAAMVQVAETLPAASALQAATVAGIMVDKSLLLQGKAPVQQHAHIHLHAIREAEELEAKLKALEATPTEEKP
ncbi:MAG: hypothetical protein ACRD5H_00205 [Nitrososphaerales archaeon]